MPSELSKTRTAAIPPRRYEQAREAVEEYIRRKSLKPGDRLPTEEALRREFGWSRVTITRALNELTWQGRLRRVQGSGTYLADPQRDAVSGIFPNAGPRLLVSASPFSPQDDYCAPLYAGIREEAAAQGVDIVYHLPVDGEESGIVPSPEAARRQNAQGVLALAWRLEDLPRILALQEEEVPVVGLALRSRTHRLPLVCTDNYGGMCSAVRHLQEAGHRRIAYTTINLRNSDVFERLSGFQYQMGSGGVPVDPAYLQVSERRRDPALLEAWWRSMDPKPTALVLDGTDASALLIALARQGVRIPEELSIVLIDEVAALRYFEPKLTVLRQPTYALGRRGLAKLLRILRGDDDGAPEVLPTELVPGDSVQNIHSAPV